STQNSSTWNVKRSNNVIKKKAILNSLKKDLIHIAFFKLGGTNIFSFFSTNKRGVIILIHKNLPFTAIATAKDNEGRYIFVKGVLHGESILLANVYAPSVQDEGFYTALFTQLVDLDCDNIILAGDFNCALLKILKELDLVDIWRHYNPLSKQYTFHSQPHLSASRIDYIFVSKIISQLITQVDIGPIGLSDHAPVVLAMQPLRHIERSVTWRMSTVSLLDDKFVRILDEQTTFYLESNDKENIDPRILWESYKRKERLARQLEIENNIKQLEKQSYCTKSTETLNELKSARTALQNLIMHKAEKDILFAKQRLFESANKPNRYLARLAKNIPAKSFITAIVDSNGQRQMENRKINDSFKEFYATLYSSEIDMTDKPDIRIFLK
uniref:exodeoxyribonuclease III n=1 Tax=Fundulus heteroclitus TaxID=8078 RepID=A0A3Q2PSH3_FUNHE